MVLRSHETWGTPKAPEFIGSAVKSRRNLTSPKTQAATRNNPRTPFHSGSELSRRSLCLVRGLSTPLLCRCSILPLLIGPTLGRSGHLYIITILLGTPRNIDISRNLGLAGLIIFILFPVSASCLATKTISRVQGL
jgi:hypothetical protein